MSACSSHTRGGDYSVERRRDLTGRGMNIVTGVLQDECIATRREWTAKQTG